MIFSFYKETENLKDHYDFLKERQEQYAEAIGVEYKLYGDDDQYKEYKETFKDRPYISEYNIINFYKIHLLYENSERYDKVAYFDFDVVPLTKENIFDIDVSDGIAVRVNHDDGAMKDFNLNMMKWESKALSTIRSPTAKYWNTKAMLMYNGMDGENDVYNTGIILANNEQLKKLAYFDDFENTLQLMKGLVTEVNGGWPAYIQSLFGYDNETLFSYKMQLNEVKLNDLTREWHFILNERFPYVIKDTKFIHVVNKRLDYVKEWYEKNNI